MKKLILLFSCIFIVNALSANASYNGKNAKIDFLVSHVKQCIENAENNISKLDSEEIKQIPGFSGFKIKHFLNNVCSLPNATYLEIGVFQGSTFVSAIYNNFTLKKAIAIDNWSEFGGNRQPFYNNLTQFVHGITTECYETDCFKIDKSLFTDPVNIYFYDGSHTPVTQQKAFSYFNDILDDVFIVMVDDWNWNKIVRTPTLNIIKKMGYKVHFSKEILTPKESQTGWWNGYFIAVLEKPD